MKKALLIGAVIFGAWYFYQGQQFGKFVKARLSGIKFNLDKTKKNLFTQLWFDVALQLSNPTAFQVSIKAVSIDILYNKKKVGAIEILGEKELKAYSQNDVVIPAVIPTFSIFATIQSAIEAFKNKTPINLQLVGIIQTSSGAVEINEFVKIA